MSINLIMQIPLLARPWEIMVLMETASVEIALVEEYLYKISYHFLWSFLRSQCGWENHLVTLNFPDFKDPAVQFDQIKLVFLVKNSTTEKEKKICKFFKYSESFFIYLFIFMVWTNSNFILWVTGCTNQFRKWHPKFSQ